MANSSENVGIETIENILSAEQFKGLKAIVDKLSSDRDAIYASVKSANSYEELVASLGYRITLTNQIHVQDCYSRVGPTGGIKAVLPYYDIPTQSSLPTLVNLDLTVSTTPKSATFFNQSLSLLKSQLRALG